MKTLPNDLLNVLPNGLLIELTSDDLALITGGNPAGQGTAGGIRVPIGAPAPGGGGGGGGGGGPRDAGTPPGSPGGGGLQPVL